MTSAGPRQTSGNGRHRPDASSLAPRAAVSPWVTEWAGLAAEVARLDRALARERATLDREAVRVANPGVPPLVRSARHWVAIQSSPLRWLARQPGAWLAGGTNPVRSPGAWLRQSAAELVCEQLAGLGPSAAELARILEESEGIAPDVLVDAIRRRPVVSRPLPVRSAAAVVRAAFGDRVSLADGPALAATPATQLHAARLADGSPVLVRVLRPGIRADLLADTRIAANSIAALEYVVPGLRDAHPLRLVELAARQVLEETDLRNEALNAIELGLALEQLGVDPHTMCRPLPDLVHATAVVYEARPGAVPLGDALERVDIAKAAGTVLGVTLESAMVHGVFHGDLRPEHLFVAPDGALVITGCGTLGRLDATLREAAVEFMLAMVGGDHAGQIAALDKLGAVPADANREALSGDLSAATGLNPLTLLTGGESAKWDALREGIGLMLRHRLRPPLELVLFARTAFSARAVLKRLAPELPLISILLPLLPRLSELGQQRTHDTATN